jgi:predicted AAA+ superfamily ATPase
MPTHKPEPAKSSGSEVSLNELARQIGLDVKTEDKYLYLLEQVFIIFRVRGFSMNMRKEVVKSSKFYFYDNSIRNAVISNFNPIELRNDMGILWENYMVSERGPNALFRSTPRLLS